MLSRLPTSIFEGIKSLGSYGKAMGRSEAGLLLWGRVILMGNAFLVSIFLIKKFGLAAVGTYTLANVAVTFLSLSCGFGLNYSLPRESMTNPQRNTVTLVWSGLVAPVSLLLIIAYAWIMAENRQEILEISLFATAGFFVALTNVANTLYLLQKRIHLSLIFPIVHTAGLLVGMIFSRTVIQFALALMVFRALGSFIPFVLLNYSRVSLANIFRCGIRGCGFLPSDMLAMFSEQSGLLILSQLLSRGDLGMFGLCSAGFNCGGPSRLVFYAIQISPTRREQALVSPRNLPAKCQIIFPYVNSHFGRVLRLGIFYLSFAHLLPFYGAPSSW